MSLAIFSFPYSNYKKAYVLKNSSGESFVAAFQRFIKDINGVPPKLILDNMRIARKFPSKENSEVILTKLFAELQKHYQFTVHFCSPHCPNQKGNVENSVGTLKKAFEQSYINAFETIADVEEFVNDSIENLNRKTHPRKNDTCESLFNHEKNRLLSLPQKDYVYYHERQGKVSNQGMVRFDHNFYAVPEMFKGEKILIRYNERFIYIVTREKNMEKERENVIAKYSRCKKKGKRKHRIWYIINKLKSKANGFLHSEEYRSMSKPEKILLEKVFHNDTSEFISFIEKIKDQPRAKLRKIVYKFNHILDNFTIGRLMEEIQQI